MSTIDLHSMPETCPACSGPLEVTRLQCSRCATQVNGQFSLGRVVNLAEPHASLLEMFLQLRGNVKEMERTLGLSYPTVRARLEEALEAAGFTKAGTDAIKRSDQLEILKRLNDGDITADTAKQLLRELKEQRR